MTKMQVKCFLAVAKVSHFGRAAEILGISQPTCSEHIKHMETSLGFPLLNRTSSSVRLTPQGEEMFKLLFRVTEELESEIEQIKRRYSDEKNEIRIGILHTWSIPKITSFANAISMYIRLKTAYQIYVLRDNSRSLLERAAKGEVDLVILPERALTQAQKEGFQPLLLGESDLYIFANHQLKMNQSSTLPDISSETMFITYENADMFVDVKEILTKYDLTPASFSPVDSFNAVLSSLDYGSGIALLPDISSAWGWPEFFCSKIKDEKLKIYAFYKRDNVKLMPFIECLIKSIKNNSSIDLLPQKGTNCL